MVERVVSDENEVLLDVFEDEILLELFCGLFSFDIEINYCNVIVLF